VIDETSAAPSGEGSPSLASPASDASLSPREAFALLKQSRNEEAEAPAKPVEPARSPERADTAAPETDPGDPEQTDDADPADDQPSIEPPRSWTKEDKEAFKLLPPEVQARVAEREQKREADFRRRQNEATELRKQAEVERSQAEQRRAQYEQALPALFDALQRQAAGEFNDVRTVDDVAKMAEDDPLRYIKWQAHQQRIQQVEAEIRGVQERQYREQAEGFARFAQEQDAAFAEKFPEFKDPEKAQKEINRVRAYLTDEIGFQVEELQSAWNGAPISLRDARMQSILRDAALYREAKKQAAAAPRGQPAPVVQKPGTVTTRSEARADEAKQALARLDRTGSRQDAFKALQALRRAR